ncbi:MAG: type II toxin-antitoxin system RelE/ParE family toxin [Acidobacteriota bacterium]
MSKVHFLRKAEDDLLDIWAYIAEDNQQVATSALRAINEKCLMLAENSKLGPARPDIAADMRYFVVGRHLILYREIQTGIEVVRVLHAARDIHGIFSLDG